MQTLLEILQKTTAYLEQKGVSNPRLHAELLLAHALGLRRLDLYLQFERPLNAAELDALRPLVLRRGKREPIEYILGSRPFAGVDLQCDARALVPRSETEELVELLATHFLQKPPATALDLGTGTGALALALAEQWPQAQITALDADERPLSLARANAVRNGLDARVHFILSSWFDALPPAHARFELIVSNPPYLTEAEWQCADPEVKNHEPYAALVAAEDGLADLRTILTTAPAFLSSGGLLALETGIAHHEALAAIAASTGAYTSTRSIADSDKRPRFFLAQAK